MPPTIVHLHNRSGRSGVGSMVTQHGSWRWVFFINVPVGLAVLLLTVWKVPESSAADQRRRFD
jgi:predicted MFS family arabinose efflux permease